MDYVRIDKTSFRKFLADHGTNATKLARENKVCSERTFTYAMKNGYISEKIAEKIAKALGVNVGDFTVQEPYPDINKKKAKKEKPFMELSREQFDKMFDKIWSDAESRGRREGYLSGLALSVAMIFNHVTDMASLDDPNILTDFNYAVEQHQKRLRKRERDQLIASLKDDADEKSEEVRLFHSTVERIKEAQESLDKKTIEESMLTTFDI